MTEVATAASGESAAHCRLSPRDDGPERTALETNAFAVLGATPRDRHSRILVLAEEAALTGDESACRTAAADLTNPKRRLGAEVSWLPGLSPARANALLVGVRQNPALARVTGRLPPLSSANLMAMAFELLGPGVTAEAWAEWIVEFAEVSEALEPEAIFRDVNEDRALSGFAQVADIAWVEAALDARRRHYKDVVIAALDRLSSRLLVAVVNKVLATTTVGGHVHAPVLIEEICAAYELQATPALDRGAEGILKVLTAAEEEVQRGTGVGPFIKKIDSLTREWDALAQPIQLAMKSRGLEHAKSSELAYAIRSFAIDIVNNHDLIEEGAKLTQMLSDVFTELPEVDERLREDATTLEGLAAQAKTRKRSAQEWASQMTYSVEIGALTKNTFSISPEGIGWKKQLLPLDEITRVRWGATRHSLNGIPTGTTYSVTVGDGVREISCSMRQEQAWSEIIARLWRGVNVRLIFASLADLQAGGKWIVGEAIVDDLGVTVPRHALFGNKNPVYLRWHELTVWTSDGTFFIGSADDKKAYAAMPYLTCDNAHILEAAIRRFFKEPSTGKLSSLLKS